MPSDQDILPSCVKTSGIRQTGQLFKNTVHNVVDVGGARPGRKTWINVFKNNDAVIFVVDISCYDLVPQKDITVNRMQESLTVFSSIVNFRWFTSLPMILILNKIDFLERKLAIGSSI